MFQYLSQDQGAELVNSMNVVADPERWKVVQVYAMASPDGIDHPAQLLETIVLDNGRRRLVWHWYDVNGSPAIRTMSVKPPTEGSSSFHPVSEHASTAASRAITSPIGPACGTVRLGPRRPLRLLSGQVLSGGAQGPGTRQTRNPRNLNQPTAHHLKR